jgi:hypothetical protein
MERLIAIARLYNDGSLTLEDCKSRLIVTLSLITDEEDMHQLCETLEEAA